MLISGTADSVKEFVSLNLKKFLVFISFHLLDLVHLDVPSSVPLLLLEAACLFGGSPALVALFVSLLRLSHSFHHVSVAFLQQIGNKFLIVLLEGIHAEFSLAFR